MGVEAIAKQLSAPKGARVDLGVRETPLDGYEAQPMFDPLPNARESLEEIRAVWILQKVSHRRAGEVLRAWIAALRPNGVLRISVPNFAVISDPEDPHSAPDTESALLGEQFGVDDMFRSIWDDQKLLKALQAAGLQEIQEWQGNAQDESRLPWALNLQGRKPVSVVPAPLLPVPDQSEDDGSPQVTTIGPRIRLATSMGRVSFTDTMFAMQQLTMELRIPHVTAQIGPFWGQSLTRAIEDCLQRGGEFILTMDHDTVFATQDVRNMVFLMDAHPEADAIAPVQMMRNHYVPMFRPQDEQGGPPRNQVTLSEMQGELLRCATAHFGLTLIRMDALRKTPRPWFWSKPDPEDRWEAGHLDDDIWFWGQFAKGGCRLYVAPRIVIGHMQDVVTWPNEELRPLHQYLHEYRAQGKPKGVWQ